MFFILILYDIYIHEVLEESFAFLTETSNKFELQKVSKDFPGGAVVENLPANAGDTGSSLGLGRSHMPRSS